MGRRADLVQVVEALKAQYAGLADVQDLVVGVQRRREVEGRVAGVDHPEVRVQLLTVEVDAEHRLELVWPASHPPTHPTLSPPHAAAITRALQKAESSCEA